jgi:tRNA-dihydrouridine synthase A
MRSPQTVAEAVAAMRAAVALPVTVKHRIGVDEQDDYEHLAAFVEQVGSAGCDRFTVHARKAWLSGLSPKENRTVPPLRYDLVHRLKADFAQLAIEINGGFASLDAVREQLECVDGVMIGRAADDDPFLFAEADGRFYGERDPVQTRRQVVEAMIPYIEAEIATGTPLHRVTRHLLKLYAGQRGARAWRRALSDGVQRPGAGIEVVQRALERVEG